MSEELQRYLEGLPVDLQQRLEGMPVEVLQRLEGMPVDILRRLELPGEEPKPSDFSDDIHIVKPPNDWLAFVFGSSVNLINLAEAVFTTFFFDEEKFSFFILAIVFTFYPMLDSIGKALVACTKMSWDDLLVDVISEGLQAYIYIYFCSFSENAKLWLPIMTAAQIFLTICLFCREHLLRQVHNSREDKTDECCFTCQTKCCIPTLLSFFSALLPGFFLFTQEESPFQTLYYQVFVAVYLWIMGVIAEFILEDSCRVLTLREDNDRFGPLLETLNDDNRRSIMLTIVMVRRGALPVVVGCLVLLLMAVANSVLSWLWWFSPNINQRFDKVYSMIWMVISSLFATSCLLGVVGAVVGVMCPSTCKEEGEEEENVEASKSSSVINVRVEESV